MGLGPDHDPPPPIMDMYSIMPAVVWLGKNMYGVSKSFQYCIKLSKNTVAISGIARGSIIRKNTV